MVFLKDNELLRCNQMYYKLQINGMLDECFSDIDDESSEFDQTQVSILFR